MRIEGHRYLMTAPGAPLAREAFAAEPAAGEVVVAVAGCGVCHTDLGYYYDGVRTNHAAAARARPRDLRPGRRGRAGRGALGGQGGHRARRAALRRVRPLPPRARPDLPRAEDARQRHPRRLRLAHRRAGDAASAPVDEARLARAGLTLADVSVVADALTTPYQAVRRAGVAPGSLAIVVGAGGVGGYCVQIARAFGAKVVAIDVDPAQARPRSPRTARPSRSTPAATTARRLKAAIAAFAKAQGLTHHRVVHLRVLGHGRGTADRVRPARARRHAVGRRLHDGQGRGAALQPDGLRRARASATGAARRNRIPPRSTSCSTARSRSSPSSRRIRSPTSTTCSRTSTTSDQEARDPRPLTSRSRTDERPRPVHANSSTTTSSTTSPSPASRYEKRPATTPRRQRRGGPATTPGSRSTTRRSSTPTPPTW